jgi:hypothetical protein
MKNILLVGSALMMLSTSAFASKARLMSLGEDKDGSYYEQLNVTHITRTSFINRISNLI